MYPARELMRFAFLPLALCALLSLPAWAQSPEEEEEDGDDGPQTPILSLDLDLSNPQKAQIYFIASGQQQLLPDFRSTLESVVGCRLQSAPTLEHSIQMLYGSCRIPIHGQGLLQRGRITIEPLQSFAQQHHLDYFTIQIHLPDANIRDTQPPSRIARQYPASASAAVKRHLDAQRYYSFAANSAVPAGIDFYYGYSQASVARAGVILLGICFLPIFLTFWMGRRALHAQTEDKASVWFSYMKSLSWMLNGSLFLWWAASESVHFDKLLQFFLAPVEAVHPWLPRVATTLAWWLPPMFGWIFCLVLSQPVQAKLRGLPWTRGDLAKQAAFSVSSTLLPIVLFINGLESLALGSGRAAALLIFAAFFLHIAARRALQKLMHMEPEALTSGELRDAAFAMAARLGVKLQQIFVIRSTKMQMANAFARQGNTIAFTDYLLGRMSRREVNFVLAHELSHLRLKHPALLGRALAVALAVAITVLSVTSRLGSAHSPFLYYATVFAIITLVPYFFSRRFEYAADAGAVAATGDPEAAISALFKLSSLNMHPLQWSKWSEKWLTHPSTTRRAEAIARKATIPFERIREIAQSSAAADHSYTLPSTIADGGKLHSTTAKQSTMLWITLSLLSVMIAIPAGLALLAGKMAWSGPLLEIVYFAGIPVTFLAYLFAANFSVTWYLRTLLPALKSKLLADGIRADDWKGIPVGLAVGAAPRSYESHTHWDLGTLFLASDRLCYYGEETKFALKREQILAIRLGPSVPSWLDLKRVYIAWKDAPTQKCGVLSFGYAGDETARSLRKKTIALEKTLNGWRFGAQSYPATPAPLAGLQSPQFGGVTGISPVVARSGRKVFAEFWLTALLAALGAALFGLRFSLLDVLTGSGSRSLVSGPSGGWYVVAVALMIRFFLYIPHFRYKDVAVLTVEPPRPNPNSAAPPSPRTENAPVS